MMTMKVISVTMGCSLNEIEKTIILEETEMKLASLNCTATDRDDEGKPCVFPFLTEERLQYTCTTVGDPYLEDWCATNTDQDHSVIQWGHCSQACRQIEDNG